MIDIETSAHSIRRKIIQTANSKFDAHFGGCLSVVEILTALFGGGMKVSPERTMADDRDRFILSKGHCALALYAALNEFGFLTDEELSAFHVDGGGYQTHAVKNPLKGIEISSGSLAMGFSLACGIATALKDKRISSRVFALVGNGEANEGLFWESAFFAGAKRLDNLCLILDENHMQNDGDSDQVLKVNNWADRLESFGWQILEIDGHDVVALLRVFKGWQVGGRPLAVIAHTIKGKGVPFMENGIAWHHNKMSPEQYSEAIKALEEVKK